MQKLARAVIGTNNVDNCSRYCQSPATTGLFRTVGYGGDSGSISDIEKADLVFIIGSNTAESHPVIATRVKSAHKLNGQKLIVSRPAGERNGAARRSLPASQAGHGHRLAVRGQPLHSRQRPRAHGVSRSVGERAGRVPQEPRAVHSGTRRRASPACRSRRCETVAHTIADAKSMCILWAMGVTQHTQGSDTSTAISNLLLVTGNYMRPGTGAYPLRGHNNVQGASDHGAHAEHAAGLPVSG